jgi:hypothetical protein
MAKFKVGDRIQWVIPKAPNGGYFVFELFRISALTHNTSIAQMRWLRVVDVEQTKKREPFGPRFLFTN